METVSGGGSRSELSGKGASSRQGSCPGSPSIADGLSSPPRRGERSLSAGARGPGQLRVARTPLARSAPLIGHAPQKLTRAFAGALSATQLDRAVSMFAAGGCFVTPDVTAVRGQEAIRSTLAQLTAGRVRLRIAPRNVYVAAGLALCNERWTFSHLRPDGVPFERSSEAAVLLCRSNCAWKLLIVAPWGIADADRQPFASMPWPK